MKCRPCSPPKKHTNPQKGNKTDRKDAKWICDLFMCEMIRPSFISPADLKEQKQRPHLHRFGAAIDLSFSTEPASHTLW